MLPHLIYYNDTQITSRVENPMTPSYYFLAWLDLYSSILELCSSSTGIIEILYSQVVLSIATPFTISIPPFLPMSHYPDIVTPV